MPSFGLTTTVNPGAGDQRWLRSRLGTDAAVSASVKVALLTEGTHYDAKTGVIPSGTALGKVEATGEYGPYDPAASDGRAVFRGFTLADDVVFAGRETAEYITVPLLVHGTVDVDHLPVPIKLTAPASVNDIQKSPLYSPFVKIVFTGKSI